MRYHTLPLLLLPFIIGCAKDVQTFDVAVKNDTQFPLTLDFNKSAKQSEYFWASPDDLVSGRVNLMPDSPTSLVDGVEIGKSWPESGERSISGHFPEGVKALLCVYRGDRLKMQDLRTMSLGRDRQNVELTPGYNHFVVQDDNGTLVIVRLPPPPK